MEAFVGGINLEPFRPSIVKPCIRGQKSSSCRPVPPRTFLAVTKVVRNVRDRRGASGKDGYRSVSGSLADGVTAMNDTGMNNSEVPTEWRNGVDGGHSHHSRGTTSSHEGSWSGGEENKGLDGKAAVGAEKFFDGQVDGANDEESDDECASSKDDDNSWYTVIDSDTGNAAFDEGSQSRSSSYGALDLGEVDSEGKALVSRAGYDRVVDIDVTKGGALQDDEDNNELLCGVGFDAIVEDERFVRTLSTEFGHECMTHVQLAAIPLIEEGHDVVIQSHTGTGKTLAFLLPLVEDIDDTVPVVQAVIVTPTRELAMQISRECERLCADTSVESLALIGGANIHRQIEKLRRRTPHIVVGTPGRLADLDEAGVLRLRKARTVVVDEIDQCLKEAFREHLERVLRSCSDDRQLIFASATGDNSTVRAFANEWMTDSVLVRVKGRNRLPSNIDHWFTIVPSRLRFDIMRNLITTKERPKAAICFVDDPRRVDMLCRRLFELKLSAGALQGNAHKSDRAEVLRQFRKGSIPLLVTTEVAARGLDVPEVTHVFNFDLPTDSDHYIHRAGRCGRAGAKGHVVNIVTADRAFVVERMGKELDIDIKRMEVYRGAYAAPLIRSSSRRNIADRRNTADDKSREMTSTKSRGIDLNSKSTQKQQFNRQYTSESTFSKDNASRPRPSPFQRRGRDNRNTSVPFEHGKSASVRPERSTFRERHEPSAFRGGKSDWESHRVGSTSIGRSEDDSQSRRHKAADKSTKRSISPRASSIDDRSDQAEFKSFGKSRRRCKTIQEKAKAQRWVGNRG